MRRILLRAHQDPFANFSAEQTLARRNIGDNVGNLLFSHSACRLLSTSSSTVTVGRVNNAPPGWINESFDVVVMPLANAFRQHFLRELNELSDVIERLRIPVVVAGVNAQLSLTATEPRGDIGPAVTRFVKAILRNSPNIGVRGERTAAYLHRLGFSEDEVMVVGCPAMFTYGPDLPAPRLPEAITPESRISLSMSPYVDGLPALMRAQAARYPNLVYTAQDLPTLGLLITGRYESALPVRAGFPASVDDPMVSSGRTVMPINVPTWLEHLSRFDFAFGTRIHGNIAAVLAGTPAYVLTHDSRTAELSEYHGLPFRAFTKGSRDVDAAELYESADYDRMLAVHQQTWRQFVRFLDAHHLPTLYHGGEVAGDFDARIAATRFRPVITLQKPAPARIAVARAGYLAERAARLIPNRVQRVRAAIRERRADRAARP